MSHFEISSGCSDCFRYGPRGPGFGSRFATSAMPHSSVSQNNPNNRAQRPPRQQHFRTPTYVTSPEPQRPPPLHPVPIDRHAPRAVLVQPEESAGDQAAEAPRQDTCKGKLRLTATCGSRSRSDTLGGVYGLWVRNLRP